MKLIKLTDDHYVIVDDSHIKEGDWFIGSDNKILLCKKTMLGLLYSENDYGRNQNGCKKITHSTEPLASMKELMEKGYDNILPINIDEIKKLIGETDKVVYHNMTLEQMSHSGHHDFVKGYNQALEDNKEKKYTEEDIVKAIEMAREGIRVTRISEWETEKEFDYNDYQIIQLLQPKTEWEVEIIDGKLKLV